MVESHYYLLQNNYNEQATEYKSYYESNPYEGLAYLNNKYGNALPKYTIGGEYNVYMNTPQAVGFWLRRRIDGTDEQVWNGLKSIMKIYDEEWFNQQIDTKKNNNKNNL